MRGMHIVVRAPITRPFARMTSGPPDDADQLAIADEVCWLVEMHGTVREFR